jgi:hypothetical protein
LTGKVEVSPTWTVEGIAHARVFDQKTQDGNPTGAQPCAADATLLCYGDDSTAANGLNGNQLANPFDPGAVLGENDRTTTHSTTTGFSLQATNTDRLFGHNNHFVVGASFDYSVTNFTASAELGTIGSGLRRHRLRDFSRAFRFADLDRSGRSSHHQSIHRPLCARHV